MESSNPRVLNSWLLFVTVLVIVVALAFYSFVYVKKNEKEQIAKRFRVLAQVGENIIKKEKGFRGVAGDAIKRIDRLDISSEIKVKLTTILRKKGELEQNKDNEEDYKNLLSGIKKIIKQSNESLEIERGRLLPGNNFLALKSFEAAIGDDNNNNDLKLKILKDIEEGEEENETNGDKSEVFVIYVSTEDFFEPLKRPDVFDEFIVFKDKNNLAEGDKQTGSDNAAKDSSVLYHTFPGDIHISGADELKSFKNGIESACLKDVTIANKNYKLFLQAVKLSNGGSDRKWYVGGLIDETKFSKETRQLAAEAIIFLLIIFSLFILAIPVVKLFLMSRFEQLKNKDVILNTLSITLGTILLILLALFFHQQASDTNNVQENLDALAQKIKVNFTVELQSAYKQLKKYDHDFKEFGSKSYDSSKVSEFKLRICDNVMNFLSDPKFERVFVSSKVKDLKKWIDMSGLKDLFAWGEWKDEFKKASSPLFYNLFKVVFWMDANGKQVLQFFTRNYFSPLSELGHRKYFKEAGNWRLSGFPHSFFMLESITSVTSGEKLAAVSMRSDLELKNNGENQETTKAKVAALTTKLTSLIDTIMPVGYGFCVMDDSGRVWFHSNSERNLQENFIEEAEKDEELLSAVYAKQSRYIDLDYQSKDYKCFIMPLANMPLYIVTFHDLAYTQAVQSDILLYTFFSLIILFAFYGLLFVLTAGINYRKSLLKGKYVSFEWLRPLKERKDDYQRLVIANIVIILFLIIFKLLVDDAGTIMLCLSAILFSFTYNYFILTGKSNREYRLRKHRLLVFFLVLLLPIDFIAGLIMDKFLYLIMFQVILLILGMFDIIKISRYKSPGEHGKSRKKQLLACSDFVSRRSYVFFLLSWLVLSYLIPSVMFYLDAYKHENKVALKYHQLKLAKHIETRNFEIDKFYRENMYNPGPGSIVDKIIKQRQHSGIYANIIGNTRVIPVNPDETEDAEGEKISRNSNFDEILYRFRLCLNPIAREKRNLVFSASSDESRTWREANNKIYLEYRINNSPNNNNSKLYVVSNIKYPGVLSSEFSILLFGAAAFLILVLAYFLIRTAARKIFSLNLIGSSKNERPHNDIQREIRDSIAAGSNLIIYCQAEEEMEYCLNLFDKGYRKKGKSSPDGNSKDESKPIKADFLDLNSDKWNPEKITRAGINKVVLIENFHLSPNDIEENLKKINRVIPLLISPWAQVVIPTFTLLTDLIEYYEENLSLLTTKDTEVSAFPKEMKLQFKKVIDLLDEANTHLVSIYPHLITISEDRKGRVNPQTSDRGLYPAIENIEDKSVKTLILDEFDSIAYFEKIQYSVKLYYNRELEEKNDSPGKKSGPITKEKIILKIQELSQHYYKQLLNSCTRKEKYVLYDFAQNMLVNTNNLDTLNILLKKGLMAYDGTFKLMNESFRNFILSSITPVEAKELVKGLNGHVNWKSYKAPLLLIALGAAVFLAFQENLLSNVNAIITTAIGGIAMLTKVSGIFSNFSLGSSK